MANNLQLSNAAANAAIDAITALLNNGFLKVYSGTQPLTADTALSGNTLLATLGFGATAFAGSVAGVATANAISSDIDIDATATASFARLLKSDASTVICDMTIGTAGTDIVLNSTAFQIHAQASLTSLTLTLPKGS